MHGDNEGLHPLVPRDTEKQTGPENRSTLWRAGGTVVTEDQHDGNRFANLLSACRSKDLCPQPIDRVSPATPAVETVETWSYPVSFLLKVRIRLYRFAANTAKRE